MNIKTLTKEYAKLTAKENAIKAEKKILAESIKDDIKKMGATQYGIPEGLFTIYNNPVWVFSKKVEKLENQVDALKLSEKESGVAKATYNELFRFTPKK